MRKNIMNNTIQDNKVYYFLICNTVEKIKNKYRELAKEHHPDLGGDVRIMQEINVQYHKALIEKNGSTGKDEESGSEWTYRYNEEVEQAVMDMISSLLAMRMQNVEMYLIGTWIWVIGDTRPYKDALKSLGLRWNGLRSAWVFHVGKWHKRQSRGGLSDIAYRYGCERLRDSSKQLA